MKRDIEKTRSPPLDEVSILHRELKELSGSWEQYMVSTELRTSLRLSNTCYIYIYIFNIHTHFYTDILLNSPLYSNSLILWRKSKFQHFYFIFFKLFFPSSFAVCFFFFFIISSKVVFYVCEDDVIDEYHKARSSIKSHPVSQKKQKNQRYLAWKKKKFLHIWWEIFFFSIECLSIF